MWLFSVVYNLFICRQVSLTRRLVASLIIFFSELIVSLCGNSAGIAERWDISSKLHAFKRAEGDCDITIRTFLCKCGGLDFFDTTIAHQSFISLLAVEDFLHSEVFRMLAYIAEM